MKSIRKPFVLEQHDVERAKFVELMKEDVRNVFGAEGDGAGGTQKMNTITVYPDYSKDDGPDGN
jgi:hypothetical protein